MAIISTWTSRRILRRGRSACVQTGCGSEALKELSRIGYDGVEIISDNSGGLSIEEFTALLKELKLNVIAIHGWGSDDEINMAKACG